MKRCPKCHTYNENNSIQCKNCNYKFKTKLKINPTIKKEEEHSEEDWPSDEWKDWNTM